MINEFSLVLIILPLLTLIISFAAGLLIRQRWIIVGAVFLAYLAATYTIFNSTFLIWVLIYSAIAILATFIADSVRRLNLKLTK